jgi:phosphoribosylformylglycinamidine cyclo-ligase
MPGFYQLGEYDVAGCIVGILEHGKLIDGRTIRPNDGVIGLASTGLHTNGYSLARKILFGKCKYHVNGYLPELRTTVGQALLKVHRSYLKPLTPLIDRGLIKGLAHITGGGLYENIPRILPQGCKVEIRRNSWPVPALFGLLQEKGRVPEHEMYRTFNMGIGMIVVVREKDKMTVLRRLGLVRQEAWDIGRIVKGRKEVRLR